MLVVMCYGLLQNLLSVFERVIGVTLCPDYLPQGPRDPMDMVHSLYGGHIGFVDFDFMEWKWSYENCLHLT